MRTITKTWVMPEAGEVIEPANELEKRPHPNIANPQDTQTSQSIR